MQGITTILFDVDGTLLDSNEFIILATEHALASLGYPVPERSVIASTVGQPFPDYYITLCGTDKDADALIDAHRAFQYKNYHLVKLFPGMIETLTYLKEKKYKMAAITTRSIKTSRQTLENANIAEFFDTIISNEDALAVKPDPAPLFFALKRLGETPEHTVMVGDSHLDIEAGKNAGTKTIRAAYGFHQDHMDNPTPDYVIQNIQELQTLL